MSGTKSGGKQAARTNKKKYGPDFYAKIGGKGGSKSTGGGFGAGDEGRARASYYGRIGGSRSRRTAKAAS